MTTAMSEDDRANRLARERDEARAALADMHAGGYTATCCPVCGWTPCEGMAEYLTLHGAEAQCLRCKGRLWWLVAVPEREIARVMREGLAECDRFRTTARLHGQLSHDAGFRAGVDAALEAAAGWAETHLVAATGTSVAGALREILRAEDRSTRAMLGFSPAEPTRRRS